MHSVYPRWRGEHLPNSAKPVFCRGLSPLARGTLNAPRPTLHGDRFIPAGAGNTRLLRDIGVRSPVYPRWRGEHPHDRRAQEAAAGLSPLARGTQAGLLGKRGFDRFIPAGAGNTILRIKPPRDCTVYPRWRGEHGAGTPDDGVGIGLSPLARGTPSVKPWQSAELRFIPAGAGNTLFYSYEAYTVAVYPRWRGEHEISTSDSMPSNGLSPLARGTPERTNLTLRLHRFIPAGAGNTLPRTYRVALPSVYPRWRGEHSGDEYLPRFICGLSPLARGTRLMLSFFSL